MLKRIALVFAGLVAVIGTLFAYNAARHLVFWSPTEDVVFDSGDIRLAGTLIKPAKAGVFPAVVMLHGAGPDTRGGVGYRAHAKVLVRNEFAVLIYDKRGTGASGGDFDVALYRDFITDAKAAVRYLANREDIDGNRIGLFGNSESGWFTPEIAADNRAVVFIINKVGPPLSWVQTVLWEARNNFLEEGAAEADLDMLLTLTQRTWAYLRAAAADPTLAVGPERESLDASISKIPTTVARADPLLAEGLPAYDPDLYNRFAENSSYDPAPYLRKITIPMLYVFGELDANVPTAQSVAFLASLHEEYQKNISVRVLPGVGHLLYTWRGLLEAGYPPGYLDFVGSWAAMQVVSD